MPFKINIGTKEGKTYKFETESEELVGKSLGEKIQGKEVSPNFEGYEFEITGTSDKSGFTSMKDVDGIGLKKMLLTYGKGMHKRSKREGKKKRSNPTPKGLRLRKTVRGKIISPAITQINLKLLKEGSKKLKEIFPESVKEAPTQNP
jgi:small subunit ribosomal protein S6e